MTNVLTGGCLCGAVRYTSISGAEMAGHCYCDDCRRSSGTSHCTHAAVPKDGLTVIGTLAFFDKPADSGNTVSRGFCPTCGSAVLSWNSAMTDMAFIRASSLDEPDSIVPALTVYGAKAPGWAHVSSDHPVFPGELPGLHDTGDTAG